MRLRPLSEAEAYGRTYGERSNDVRAVAVARRPRFRARMSGEELRLLFQKRLDAREPSQQ